MIVGLFPVLFVGWELVKRSRWLKPENANLVTGAVEIDGSTRTCMPDPGRTRVGEGAC